MFSIFFLILFLSASTELYQLYKLPFLVEHYVKHRREDKSISWLSYLKLHYTGPVKADKDMKDDMRLPFKTCCHNFGLPVNAEEPQIYVPFLVKEIFVLKNEFFLSDCSLKPSAALSAVWQPPKKG